MSHPLRIDNLPLGNGRLGITFCPGKKGESHFGAVWDRDIELDMDAIKRWGANAVLSLIEDHECELLGVPGLGEAVKAHDIEWFHFPIRDLDVPTSADMRRWRSLSPKLHKIFESGGRLLIHCRGGLGRAGTIAALLLTERGWSAPHAIQEIRNMRPGAIETAEQERWLMHRAKHFDLMGIRLHASLLGGALGDSLGADIEFLTIADIRRRFPDGIHELPAHQGLRGAITDDTQMTLFTAEGIIRAYIRSAQKGICHPPSVIHHALLRWLRTQDRETTLETDDAGLISDSRLWMRRAPGLTCLSSLEQSSHFGACAHNDSKGCGTIMRVAPIALMMPRDQVRATAIEASALTHGHPTGQLAAAAWAEMLADVANGSELEEVATSLALQYDQIESGEETAGAIRMALDAPRDGKPETVERLGGGWTAEEALSIALYSCLAGNSLNQALKISVLHSGDSDSTGAIAGNMLGLMDPSAVLTHRWSSLVEGADIISRLVKDYLHLKHESGAAVSLAKAYPGY